MTVKTISADEFGEFMTLPDIRVSECVGVRVYDAIHPALGAISIVVDALNVPVLIARFPPFPKPRNAGSATS